MEIQRQKITCKHCGWKWLTRFTPQVCPRCHNNYRNKPKIKIRENEN